MRSTADEMEGERGYQRVEAWTEVEQQQGKPHPLQDISQRTSGKIVPVMVRTIFVRQ